MPESAVSPHWCSATLWIKSQHGPSLVPVTTFIPLALAHLRTYPRALPPSSLLHRLFLIFHPGVNIATLGNHPWSSSTVGPLAPSMPSLSIAVPPCPFVAYVAFCNDTYFSLILYNYILKIHNIQSVLKALKRPAVKKTSLPALIFPLIKQL